MMLCLKPSLSGMVLGTKDVCMSVKLLDVVRHPVIAPHRMLWKAQDSESGVADRHAGPVL